MKNALFSDILPTFAAPKVLFERMIDFGSSGKSRDAITN
jgi:hypothetical protein